MSTDKLDALRTVNDRLRTADAALTEALALTTDLYGHQALGSTWLGRRVLGAKQALVSARAEADCQCEFARTENEEAA